MDAVEATATVLDLVSKGRVFEAVRAVLAEPPSKTRLRLLGVLLCAHKSLAADPDAEFSLEPICDLEDAINSECCARFEPGVAYGGSVVSFGKSDLQLGYLTSKNVNVQCVPRRLDLPVAITAVEAASTHSIALDVNWEVWSWGQGQGGRLGHGDNQTRILPSKVEDLVGQRVVRIAASKDHSLAVTDEGLLFSWGSNEKGQLGLIAFNRKQSLRPRRVKLPRDDGEARRPLVVLVAASPSHSVVSDTQGRVFSWGSNDKGQLGYREASTSWRSSPKLVPTSTRWDGVEQISAAEGVTCFLSNQGHVFQAGLGQHNMSRVPIKYSCDEGDHEDWSFGGRSKESSARVTQISCGPNHTAAVTKDGMLFTWGADASLLGHADIGHDRENSKSHTTKPLRVAALQSQRIVSVSCAQRHTCATDDEGNLYTWGDGACGVLGTIETYQPNPTRVPHLRRVVQAVASDSHTIGLIVPSRPEFFKVVEEKSFASPEFYHNAPFQTEEDIMEDESVPSLAFLCEGELAGTVNTWNALRLWEFAQQTFSHSLDAFCENFVIQNFGAVLANSGPESEERIAGLCGARWEDVEELVSRFRKLPRSHSWESCGPDPDASKPLALPTVDDVTQKTPERRRRPSDLEEILNISTPRLKKKILSCQRQQHALEELLLKKMSTTPERGSRNHVRTRPGLEEQLAEIKEILKQLQMEMNSRPSFDQSVPFNGGGMEPLFCKTCNVRVTSEEAMLEHVSGKRHRKNQVRERERVIEEAAALVDACDPQHDVTETPKFGNWTQNRERKSHSFSLKDIQQEEEEFQRRKSSSQQKPAPNVLRRPSTSEGRTAESRDRSGSLHLPGSAYVAQMDPKYGLALRNFMTKKARKRMKEMTATAWDTKSIKPFKPLTEREPMFPEKRSVLETMQTMSLSEIQAEQQLESASFVRPLVDSTENRWGFRQIQKSLSFTDIQTQQEEEESERLAREIAEGEKKKLKKQQQEAAKKRKKKRKQQQRRRKDN